MEKLDLWLGTQSAYDALMFAEVQKVKAMATPDYKAWFDDDEDEDEVKDPNGHFLLSVQGDVGVLAISGSLVNGNSGFARYFGVTGYNDIREALAKAVANPRVKSILLNVNSGGGHVAGCHETAQLIQRVDKLKPIVTYTGGSMMSAALWLGSSGRQIIAAETAQVGSIGVMTVHQSHARQLKEEGVDVKVIRAGTEKCLANPYEELSEKAQAKLTANAEYLYGIFMGHVANARGANMSVADAAYGQGREFFGEQAKSIGLVDVVGTYEEAFMRATKLAQKRSSGVKLPGMKFGATNLSPVLASSVAMAENVAHNPAITKGQQPMDSLSEEQLAAMAAGIDITGNGETQEPATAPVAATPAPVETAQVAVQDSAVTVLQGMLATTQADLVKAQAELTVTKQSQEALAAKFESQMSAFVGIARASVRTMGIHFGMKAEAVDGLSAEQVLAEHSRLSDAMKAKFKTGRVAVAAVADTETSTTQVDANFLARAKKMLGGNK